MAFVIQVSTREGVPAFWVGGDTCSEHGEDAARFMSEADAEATIELLQRATGLSAGARAINLGEVI